jgi:hypothetical protein
LLIIWIDGTVHDPAKDDHSGIHVHEGNKYLWLDLQLNTKVVNFIIDGTVHDPTKDSQSGVHVHEGN